jgi:hypothetical protein
MPNHHLDLMMPKRGVSWSPLRCFRMLTRALFPDLSGAELRIQKSRVIYVDGETGLDSSARPKNSAAQSQSLWDLLRHSGRRGRSRNLPNSAVDSSEWGLVDETWTKCRTTILLVSLNRRRTPGRRRDKQG